MTKEQPGELPQHIIHAETRAAPVTAWKQVEVTATDVAEVVVFAVTRHPRFAVHEVLVWPVGQEF
ncbi:hypothetical protein [Polymorphospora rubra]|uniref:hypothetical protein n=1 Tax=Polymorphospora rubra TaxID=338584 RepID=UPI0033C299DF